MSPGFPLLRTPQLALTIIFNELNNYEAVNVAMCSEKAYQHVRLCRSKPKNWRIELISNYILLKEDIQKRYIFDRFGFHSIARIARPQSLSLPKTEIIDFNGYKVPVNFSPKTHFHIFWNDVVLGMKIVTDYICNLFKMDIHGLIIEKSSIWMIDWLNSRQKSYAMTKMEGNKRPNLNDDEYRKIITGCRATEKLILNELPPTGFKFNGNFPKTKILMISPSQWVTLENLKAMDSINIHLAESNLTVSDINLFLKHWLAGGSPRLRFMNISMAWFMRGGIFTGLETEAVSKMRTFRLVDGRSVNFEDSYDIERRDGAKVSILFDWNWIGDNWENRGNMCIVVWPATD